jgi:hypothetical protein
VRAVALVLLVCAATACGSTVQVKGGVGLAGGATGSTDGLGGPASTTTIAAPSNGSGVNLAPGAVAGAAGGRSASGAGPVGTGSNTAGTTGGAGMQGGTGAGGPSGTVRNGPGVTAKTIAIGVPYDPDVAQGQAALGSSVPVPDVKHYVEIVVADLNAKGGIAGRTIKAVFDPVRSQDGQSAAQHSAEVCTYFTQDHPVFAVMPTFSSELSQCLGRAGVVSATGSLAGYDEATYRTLPTFFDVGALSTARIAENLVTALQAEHYFTGWNVQTGAPGSAPVKVGILAPDNEPWRRAIPKVLVPALARIGIKVDPANIVIWHFPDNAAAQSESVAQMQAAVLKFKSNGVTHFIPAEVNSASFFAHPADSQQYHPRYALNSATGVGAQAGGLIPYSMLNGAVGLGWSPAIDLSPQAGSSPMYAGRGTAACLETFRRAQQPTASSNERAVALLVCDAFKVLKASIEAVPAGQPIAASTAIGGLEALGSSFPFAGLVTGNYAPGRHYPVSDGWQMHWDATCECQVYSGKRYRLR